MLPYMAEYGAAHGLDLWGNGATIEANFKAPLAFDPEADWGYGAGHD